MEQTNNFLDWVHIQNFKSIKDLRFDCKRINIFIGKPNVGKSNILEALGLLGAEYGKDTFVNGFVRYEDLKHLFYDNDTTQFVQVETDKAKTILLRINTLNESAATYRYFRDDSGRINRILEKLSAELTADLEIKSTWKSRINSSGHFIDPSNTSFQIEYLSTVKKYDFFNITNFESSFPEFLLPPDGRNLFSIIDRRNDLKNDFGKLFTEQNLELVLSKGEQLFELQKREGFYVNKYPYFSIADTYRRFIFYLTAIESNKNSTIIFEEPEVHSFPPYTQELAYRMIYDDRNQYFISTHSPYMLHPFIEKMDYTDLNVFITYYQDYQSYVRALTEEEFRDILDYSTNVFFNLRKFEPNA